MGDLVWHIKCIHTWSDAFKITWGCFCYFSGFFKIFDPYLKFSYIFGVSWQNKTSDEEHWFITPLFKLNCPLFELCFISFCREISNCHSLGHTVVAVLQNLVKNSFHPKLMKLWSYHDVLYVKQNPPYWWLSG